MKKSEAKRLKKLVLRYCEDWYSVMGLGTYHRKISFSHKTKGFKQNGSIAAARIWTDWRYQNLYIEICLPALVGLSDSRIEGIVVHELLHALVDPISGDKSDLEEFVVTNLTNVLIWVRNKERRNDNQN